MQVVEAGFLADSFWISPIANCTLQQVVAAYKQLQSFSGSRGGISSLYQQVLHFSMCLKPAYW